MLRIIYSYNGTEKEFQSAEAQMVIGRSTPGAVCQINLSPDFKVSRSHARIFLEGNGYWIEDLGSTQGTKVNGQEIKGRGKQELQTGDVLIIGETTLRVENAEASGPEEGFAPNEDTMMPTFSNSEPAVTIGTT